MYAGLPVILLACEAIWALPTSRLGNLTSRSDARGDDPPCLRCSDSAKLQLTYRALQSLEWVHSFLLIRMDMHV